MSPRSTGVTGVILAGGQSTRFGKNKAFAPLHGKPMIERVLEVLSSLFLDTILVTNDPDPYTSLPAKVIRDEIPHQGPLEGIVTALRRVNTPYIFAVACDMPLLNSMEIQKILQHRKNFDALIPIYGGQKQYLMALYSKQLLLPLDTYLKSGKRSLKGFPWDDHITQWLPLKGCSSFNVNTPGDLQRLEEFHA